jgi:transcription initiation factor IIF auxiliary subunit
VFVIALLCYSGEISLQEMQQLDDDHHNNNTFHFTIGNTVRNIPKDIFPESTRKNYQWRLFVEAYDPTDSYFQVLEQMVKQVTFNIGSTFTNNEIVVKEAPFSIERIGHKEFDATVEIVFVNGVKKVYNHHLSLNVMSCEEEDDCALHVTKHSIQIQPEIIFKQQQQDEQQEREYDELESNRRALEQSGYNGRRVKVQGVYKTYAVYNTRDSDTKQEKKQRDAKSTHAILKLDDDSKLFLGIYYTTVGERPLYERQCLNGRFVEVCGTLHQCIPSQHHFHTISAPYITVESILLNPKRQY